MFAIAKRVETWYTMLCRDLAQNHRQEEVNHVYQQASNRSV